MIYPAALTNTLDGSGQQTIIAPSVLQSDTQSCAAYFALSDRELEQWFRRHRSELVNLAHFDLAPIAGWLQAIGPPTNDNHQVRHR